MIYMEGWPSSNPRRDLLGSLGLMYPFNYPLPNARFSGAIAVSHERDFANAVVKTGLPFPSS